MTIRNLSSAHDYAKSYAELGWSLVHIPAGKKAPTTFGWQTKATPPDHWIDNPTHNMGLLHGPSGTCALDIDSMPNMRILCEALGIDLDAILASAPRIVGRPDRGKALFRAPVGDYTTRRLAWPVSGDPRRTEVVFELRAGSVQDVLPPSIHPETGNPYVWAGADWRALPPLPDQILTIWREWDRFRHQLADLCPWAPSQSFKRPPPKPRRQDQESVIDTYNASMTIEEALAGAGYRKIGSRWLSPNSTSRIPGVVVFDQQHAYSHHASDPFDSAHTFDAFDVFVHYQHLGNVQAAVKAAADLLDIKSAPEAFTEEEREAIKHGAAIWDGIRKKKPRKADADGIPDHLLTIPGVLADFVDWAQATAIKPQRQFDVQAALAFASVVMGRRWVTDYRNMSSLYFLNVGKTGSGKEHAKTALETALEACDLSKLIGPSGYTSAGGVLSSLRDRPCHVAIIDEFGLMLTSSQARGNHNKRDALGAIMEAFGRQMGTIRNTGFSTVAMTEAQKKQLEIAIKHPSLTLLGMTTPATFYEAISAADIASGFLNRFLIVETKIGRQVSRRPARVEVPQSIIDWAKYHASAGGESIVQDQGPEFPPEPIEIPFSAASRQMLRELEVDIIKQQDDVRNETLAAMMNRQREIVMRLSLIVARSLGDDEISPAAVQWAIDYAQVYATQTRNSMAANMAEGETDALRKKVADAIMAAGPVGLTMRELINQVPRLGNVDKFRRDGILQMVCQDYPIERAQITKTGPGRPSIIHRKIEE